MGNPFSAIVASYKSSALAHPKTTFSAAIAGVVAITQSQADFETLFGHAIGPKIFVLAKWFGGFCIAVAAAGRSVVNEIDNPPAKTP